MKDGNVLQEKSYAFGQRAVAVYLQLVRVEHEFVLSRQLVRSATSIGANVEEAIGGQSRKDFTAKLGIAYREAREANFWLRMLRDAKLLNDPIAASLIADCEELMKIMARILLTLRGGGRPN